MNNKRLILGIGIFWLVLLGGFIGLKEYTLRTGTEVLLKLQPVDPRDLFRGDYVILSYDINRITDTASSAYKPDDTVYANLKLNGGVAEYTGISRVKPADGLFIAGKVAAVRSSQLNVTYGIESFFVPEGEGRVIERSIGDMYAKVVVDGSGRGIVKSLVKDGREITF